MTVHRSARGIVLGHALKHRDKKSGTNGPTTVKCRVADLETGAETNVEMAMDDSVARTTFPVGGHVEVTIVQIQGELQPAAGTKQKPDPPPTLPLGPRPRRGRGREVLQ